MSNSVCAPAVRFGPKIDQKSYYKILPVILISPDVMSALHSRQGDTVQERASQNHHHHTHTHIHLTVMIFSDSLSPLCSISAVLDPWIPDLMDNNWSHAASHSHCGNTLRDFKILIGPIELRRHIFHGFNVLRCAVVSQKYTCSLELVMKRSTDYTWCYNIERATPRLFLEQMLRANT